MVSNVSLPIMEKPNPVGKKTLYSVEGLRLKYEARNVTVGKVGLSGPLPGTFQEVKTFLESFLDFFKFAKKSYLAGESGRAVSEPRSVNIDGSYRF